MLESCGLASIAAEAAGAAPSLSAHCLSYDDQCVFPALPEVQVKTKLTGRRAETPAGFCPGLACCLERASDLGMLILLKPLDPFKNCLRIWGLG